MNENSTSRPEFEDGSAIKGIVIAAVPSIAVWAVVAFTIAKVIG